MGRRWDVGSSWAASVALGAAGLSVVPLGARPALPMTLYDFESCPFCRKVRSALTVLDLDVIIKPCPKGGTRFRGELTKLGGKLQVPYLIDPNADVALYESADIVAHLFKAYGVTEPPVWFTVPGLAIATGSVASGARLGRGSQARPSTAPAQMLELWSIEASPYSRLVREVLSELELPYLLHNIGKNSPRKKLLKQRAGSSMAPYLFDPNTGREMHESADIIAYLESTYAG